MSQRSRQQRDEDSVVIPLQDLSRHDAQLRRIFDKYDYDRDGRLSILELRAVIESHKYEHNIHDDIVKRIMQISDADSSGYLDFNEFRDMVRRPELRNVFVHLFFRYVNTIIPRRDPAPTAAADGAYNDEYKCLPPPVCMLLISLVEIVLFAVDAAVSHVEGTDPAATAVSFVNGTGPVATALIYDPCKRYEAWRYFTYMLVHTGWTHLMFNLIVQILLGLPLEMVHKWWRVLIIYSAGVVAGSLGTSITDPRVFLAGASGGVYALMATHVSTIALNWSEMEYATLQLLVFLVLAVVDTGIEIYKTYVLKIKGKVGYMAHFTGALAGLSYAGLPSNYGLLVGIGILRNLKVRSWERKLWWFAVVIYFALMTVALLINIFWTTHFPHSKYGVM